jgi:hypothetical protein
MAGADPDLTNYGAAKGLMTAVLPVFRRRADNRRILAPSATRSDCTREVLSSLAGGISTVVS